MVQKTFGQTLQASFAPKTAIARKELSAMKISKKSVIKDDDYITFIGKNSEKYLSKFNKFRVGEIDNFTATWHWPAFFVPFLWMFYRKLYGWAILAFFIGIIPYINILSSIVWAIVANYIYYKHAKKKILEIKQQHPSATTQRAVIAVKGGTGVAALIIAGILGLIAVIGILAAISIPAYMDYTVRSQVSEVASGFDALAASAGEYHAAKGQFPGQEYSINDLASLSERYGTFSCPARASNNDITYRFTFNNVISSLNGCTLDMEITYEPGTGYVKTWLSTSTLPERLRPRQ
jgi:Tfp pilus assembly major pilin PilA